MIRQAFIDYHYAAYQIIVGLLGLAAAIHILFEFSVALSLGYATATVASFLLGQGIVALIQHKTSRRSRRSGDMFD